MSPIVWNKRYDVNVRELDEQHKQLAEFVNVMNDAVKAREDRATILKGIADLIEHARLHFSTEESLMQQYGYPDYDKHKQEHKDLLNLLSDIKGKFVKRSHSFADFDYDLADNWLVIHTDWFSVHITHSDRDLGVFLNERNIF